MIDTQRGVARERERERERVDDWKQTNEQILLLNDKWSREVH